MENKLWGGRFKEGTHPSLENLNSSITLDARLFREDVEGSKGYAQALNKINLLNNEEMISICEGLDLVKSEWEKGEFQVKLGDEDIHTANERRLKELIGEAATKLHVGRSRNDQVVTDMKLWLLNNLPELQSKLRKLVEVIVVRASREVDIIMPGYTHLQRAQPIRWSHFLLSHAFTFQKDCDKLKAIIESCNIMPLGSGALAGNPFNIDRKALANTLNFSFISENSMQAVGDRDFVADFLFWSSMIGLHLSRLSEDLIIYNSKEFGFITVNDSFSTGSSLMPQKRNPDSLELIRGIGGSLFGHCCSFMMVLKSLPSTYNKDLQSDKEFMFGSFDKLNSIIDVAIGTVETLQVNPDKCKAALSYEMLATDIAYYLVRKGVAFRQAHNIAGKVVAQAEKKGVNICDLTLEELRAISSHFTLDIGKLWNYENSVEQYQSEGGTAKISVLKQIVSLEKWLKN